MKTVFVVEDSRAEQRLIVSLLQQSGYNAMPFDSAEAAKQGLVAGSAPDLVVLDIVMPGSSGLDLCRYLRETPQFADIPVVFCSSKDQDFDRFWALRQGGNAYITKPFTPKELLQVVRQQLP
ncbi:two component transcriptional regulator, winged-helix family [Rubidibacter lacunae KORDI 51-2]|uniref:Two component transcriptional regulator, winged-helix family n=1 Tax=Rubidibacter lacunae KORDI 51-2 TaxID=582515 RepID=U5D6U3_9CHRO|nr:response regulator [Rubidibacter lacunae]ERN40378.1 two component transcriptional regulator, winged-helix family [Rubidibacter lacunae KORDI 51-2]